MRARLLTDLGPDPVDHKVARDQQKVGQNHGYHLRLTENPLEYDTLDSYLLGRSFTLAIR